MTVETIILSKHAVERFQERVRPALSLEAAEEELAQLVLVGEVLEQAPAWHADRAAQDAPAYLLIADVILPLQPTGGRTFVATTCLPRGCMSEASRARRNRARRHQSRRRRERQLQRARPRLGAGVS